MFSNLIVLIFAVIITAVVHIIGFKKKKSIFSAIMLFVYTILLIIHISKWNSAFDVIVDFIGMVVSITIYLIIDEIEIRRKKITQVFEDRYKE